MCQAAVKGSWVTQAGKQAAPRARVRSKRRPCWRARARPAALLSGWRWAWGGGPARRPARPRTRTRPPPGTASRWGPQAPSWIAADSRRQMLEEVRGTSRSGQPLRPHATTLPLQFKPCWEICTLPQTPAPPQPERHRKLHLFGILFQAHVLPKH